MFHTSLTSYREKCYGNDDREFLVTYIPCTLYHNLPLNIKLTKRYSTCVYDKRKYRFHEVLPADNIIHVCKITAMFRLSWIKIALMVNNLKSYIVVSPEKFYENSSEWIERSRCH